MQLKLRIILPFHHCLKSFRGKLLIYGSSFWIDVHMMCFDTKGKIVKYKLHYAFYYLFFQLNMSVVVCITFFIWVPCDEAGEAVLQDSKSN